MDKRDSDLTTRKERKNNSITGYVRRDGEHDVDGFAGHGWTLSGGEDG